MTGAAAAFAPNIIALSLVVAAIWGVSDFLGGMATRRSRAVPVVAVAHGLSLVALVVAAVACHAQTPSRSAIAWGLVTGLCSGVAVIAFYAALAAGEMGLTSALAGLLTAVIPVIFAAFTEGSPTATQVLGFVLAAAAIWLLAYEPGGRPHARGLGLATLAGFGFGAFLITSKFASQDAVLWPLAYSRLASAGLALAILMALHFRLRLRRTRGNKPEKGIGHTEEDAALTIGRKMEKQQSSGSQGRQSSRQWMFFAGAAGLLEALGNLLYMLATHAGRLDVAAVLSSLYPAGTILLAMGLLHERVTRRRAVGIVLALAAAVVISL